MGLLDIDYDNLVVKKDIVKDRTVYTIDNFYKYPNAIIKVYKSNKPLHFITVKGKYPGKRLDMYDVFSKDIVDRHLDDLKQLLISIGFDHSKFLSQNDEEIMIENNNTGHDKSCLVISEFDKEIGLKNPLHSSRGSMSNPHTDSNVRQISYNKLACLCYLSKNEDIHGGTGLYRHKEFDVHSLGPEFTSWLAQQVIQKIEAVGATSVEEQAEIIENMYSNFHHKLFPRDASEGFMNETNEHFELLHLFPMKFNRLVVYDSDLLHAIYIKDGDFFDTHERLSANYFLIQPWPKENSPSVKQDVRDRFEKLLKICKKLRPQSGRFLL